MAATVRYFFCSAVRLEIARRHVAHDERRVLGEASTPSDAHSKKRIVRGDVRHAAVFYERTHAVVRGFNLSETPVGDDGGVQYPQTLLVFRSDKRIGKSNHLRRFSL